MAMVRREKRPKKAKTPTKTSELKHVPPLPPLPLQFLHIPTAQPIVGLYEILAPGMLVGVSLPGQVGSKVEIARP